ncbi:MAG: alpha-amylase family glycosyl hydrolase [Chloroflexota bacterium]
MDSFMDIATAPGDLPMSEIVARHTVQESQFRHDNVIQPPRPDHPVKIRATSGARLPLARAELWYTTDGSMPDADSAAVTMQPTATDWQFTSGYLTHWCGAIPGQPAGTAVRYKIAGWLSGTSDGSEPDLFAMDGSGFWYRSDPADAITTFAFPVEEAPVHPKWVQDAVIYQIFLDRFHPGTPGGRFQPNIDPQAKHGGTLRGVEQTLPYLADLGVTCLWLSPVGISESYHHYDATDYFTIDPNLGINEDLCSLTNAAHALGMRVLLDFVPSHLSADHAAFRAAQADPNASTYDWFTFYEWPSAYRSFLDFVPSLVSLNTNSDGARQHIIDSAIYWIQEFGIDGYRLDHAIGHGMDFWTQFRTALVAIKPDVVTIGEVTDTPDRLRAYRGRLHDVLDFPLARALRLTFATGDWSLSELNTFLDAYDRFMATGPGRVSFLDNHDMDRFLHVAGGDKTRLKLAALCQFALEQPPVIYYGTEIGLEQARGMDESGFGGDVEVRRDMVWDSAAWDYDLLAFYKSLIAGRAAYPALRYGSRELVYLDPANRVYAFRRTGDADVIIAFNLSDTPQSIPLPAGDYQVILSTVDGVSLSGDGITLPPSGGAWLAST